MSGSFPLSLSHFVKKRFFFFLLKPQFLSVTNTHPERLTHTRAHTHTHTHTHPHTHTHTPTLMHAHTCARTPHTHTHTLTEAYFHISDNHISLINSFHSFFRMLSAVISPLLSSHIPPKSLFDFILLCVCVCVCVCLCVCVCVHVPQWFRMRK